MYKNFCVLIKAVGFILWVFLGNYLVVGIINMVNNTAVVIVIVVACNSVVTTSNFISAFVFASIFNVVLRQC